MKAIADFVASRQAFRYVCQSLKPRIDLLKIELDPYPTRLSLRLRGSLKKRMRKASTESFTDRATFIWTGLDMCLSFVSSSTSLRDQNKAMFVLNRF